MVHHYRGTVSDFASRIFQQTERDEPLTHRDIAMRLGIGRARVFYHEQCALEKIRKLFAASGVKNAEDFDSIGPRELTEAMKTLRRTKQRQESEQYSPQHGWLTVHRIRSINDGSESVEDVVRAYQFLKLDHDAAVRPPVLVSTPNGVESLYRVEAATAIDDGTMKLRCWPTTGEPRTVTHLLNMTCTAIVESEFDSDEQGDFDIPILICTILSSRPGRDPKKG